MEQDIINSIKRNLKTQLEEQANTIIEEQTEIFRTKLKESKCREIDNIINAVDVHIQKDMINLKYEVNILYRPQVIVKR